LARTLFHLMLRHGPKLERRQLQLMRIVDISMELLAMLCTIARARSLATRKGSAASEALGAAELFCRQARIRIDAKFREIRHNTDALIQKVGAHALNAKFLEMESHFGNPQNLGSIPLPPSAVAPHAPTTAGAALAAQPANPA
jgi:hypothetical protein